MLFRVLLCGMIIFSGSTYADDFHTGIAAHLLAENNDVNYGLQANDKVKESNFSIVRMDAGWNDVEVTKGIYSIPNKWDVIINDQVNKNISPMLILAYGNKNYNNEKPVSPKVVAAYLDYVKYVVQHFKGKVKYYQIWNEWTSRTGQTKPGSVDDYKKLVKVVYPVIKSIDPSARIVTGEFSNGAFGKALGLSRADYYRDFLTPDMSPYTDIIGVHPYVLYRNPPYNEYSGYYEQVEYVKNLMNSIEGFSNKKLFVTEIGWSTANTNYGVSQEKQNELLERTICDAKKLGVSAVIIYQLRDYKYTGGNETESGFGLYDYQWKAKKSASLNKNIKCL